MSTASGRGWAMEFPFLAHQWWHCLRHCFSLQAKRHPPSCLLDRTSSAMEDTPERDHLVVVVDNYAEHWACAARNPAEGPNVLASVLQQVSTFCHSFLISGPNRKLLLVTQDNIVADVVGISQISLSASNSASPFAAQVVRAITVLSGREPATMVVVSAQRDPDLCKSPHRFSSAVAAAAAVGVTVHVLSLYASSLWPALVQATGGQMCVLADVPTGVGAVLQTCILLLYSATPENLALPLPIPPPPHCVCCSKPAPDAYVCSVCLAVHCSRVLHCKSCHLRMVVTTAEPPALQSNE